EPVRRETIETAAMLVRMSESHVRFGTFEVFYYRQQPERVRELADYVISNHFPELAAAAEDKYRQFLLEVARRTARLIAKWQAVGFAHGVMNTDNMSILGLTLDYGPFGFLDDYRAGFVCNHSDYSGRYAFDQQPAVGLWNVSRLAQTLVNLITVEEATAALGVYQPAFAAHYGELMRAKLGLTTDADEDAELLLDLLSLLEANGVDYTNFFRRLGNFETATDARHDELRDMFVEPDAFDAWAARYRARLLAEASADAARKSRMDAVNPKYVLRNYLAQDAITAAVERRDYTEIERLRETLSAPFKEQPGRERYAGSPPDWGKRLAVSCSS
ncbi:MAG: serine/tyrosine/threonine adenylyltransferase, partial [Pyrinomonadaceae bacterium]|nr:serine/tyrosine/threonine adenylyltransferase [Pyrinomonadaceae bacterium]